MGEFMTMTIYLVIAWLALNVAFVALRLWVTREPSVPPLPLPTVLRPAGIRARPANPSQT